MTPAVTNTTAVEGLRSIDALNAFLGSGQAVVMVIALAIISILFMIQNQNNPVIQASRIS